MEDGGVVPDLELPSDSLQTSLVSPLLSEEESTASDIAADPAFFSLFPNLETTGLDFDESLFPEGYVDEINTKEPELTARSLDAIPDDLKDAYILDPEFNRPDSSLPPLPQPPTASYAPSLLTGERIKIQPTQDQVDNYKTDVKRYNEAVVKQNEDLDASIENYKTKQAESKKNLSRFFREVDTSTIGTTFNNEYDLSEIKLSKERLPVNLPSLKGQSNRANVEFQDVFGELTVESFLAQVRKDILDNSEDIIATYQKELDDLTGINLSENEKLARARGAVSLEEESKKQERIKELKSFIETGTLSEDAIKDQLPFRGGAAIDNLIMKNVALSKEQWEKSNDAKKGDTYEDYLEKLEMRIYVDSVKDPKLLNLSKEVFGDTQQEGIVAIRPLLGGGIELGKLTDRDSHWNQRNLNLEIGWWKTLRGFSKFGAKTRRFLMEQSVRSGVPLSNEEKFYQKISDEKAVDFERRMQEEMRKLSKDITQISVSEDVLNLAGESVFFNRGHITELEVNALTDARKLAYRTEIAMPSFRSMPLSMTTMALALPAAALGGHTAAFAVQGILMGGIAGAEYYDDELSNDLLYGHHSDNMKTLFAFSHGAMESAGEITGNLILGKALGLGKLGGKRSMFGGKYKGFDFDKEVFINRSPMAQARKMLTDFFYGVTTASAIGAGEEAVEEWITGYGQKAIERYAQGLDFDHWINTDEANHSARIGMYSGSIFGPGIKTMQNTGQLFEIAFSEASAESKLRRSLMSQIGTDWGQGVTKDQWAKIEKLTKELGFTPGMNTFEHAGIWGDPKNQDKIAEINELFKNFEGNVKGIQELVIEAGEDPANAAFLAAFAIESNLMKMHEALSIEVNKNSAGRLVDQYGRFLPKEWESSYFGKEGAKLTPEQRKAEDGKRKLKEIRLRIFKEMLKNNVISQGFKTSGLDTQEGSVDRDENAIDLEKAFMVRYNKGAGDDKAIDEETMKILQESGISDEVISQIESILKENRNLEIVIHQTKESIDKVSLGVEGLYLETEKTTEGFVLPEFDPETGETSLKTQKGKELHIYAGKDADISRVLTHEYGHLLFERFINGESVISEEEWNDLEGKKEGETYADYVKEQKEQGENFLNAMAQQIIEIKDPKIQEIVKFTLMAEGLGATERSKQVINKEIVNNFMEAVGRGEFVRRDNNGELIFNVQGISLKGADMGFKNWGKKLLMDFGFKGDLNFSQEEDVIMLAIKFSQRARALGLQKGKSSTEAKIDIDKAEAADTVTEAELTRQAEDATGLKSKRVDPADIDFSQGGITLYYTQNVIGQKRGVYAPIFVETDRDGEIKDRAWFKPIESKSHLEYWYAGKTGNSIARVAISDLHYYDGDTRVDINSPDVVKKYGKPVFRSLPTTVSDLKIKKRKRVAKDRDALISERDKLSQHMGNIHFDSDKKLNWNTNANDFLPIPKEIGTAMPEGTTEQIEKDIENYTIGIANVEALIESDLGQAELAEMAGGKTENIDTSKYPEVFNMSGLRMSETFEEKADRLNNEVDGYGAPWQLLPKESESYKLQVPDLRLVSQEDLDYASDRMDRLKDGEPFQGDPINLDLGLASTFLKGVKKSDGFTLNKLVKTEYLSNKMKEKGWIVSPNAVTALIDYMEEYNITEDDLVYHKANYDANGAKEIKITFKTEKGGTGSYIDENSGGVMGPQKLQDLGSNQEMVLSHSTERNTTQAANNINQDKNGEPLNDKHHVFFYQVLDWNNSLNSPKGFSVFFGLIQKYLELNPSHTDAIIGALNKTLGQKDKDSKIMGERFATHLSETYKDKEGNSVEFKGLNFKKIRPGSNNFSLEIVEPIIDDKEKTTEQIAQEKQEKEEGLQHFLNTFKDIDKAIELGFVGDMRLHFLNGLNKRIIKSINKTKGLTSYFPTKSEFLDAINQEEFKGSESGDIVSMSIMEPGRVKAVKDVRESIKTPNVSKEDQKNFNSFLGKMAYIDAILTTSKVKHIFFEEYITGKFVDALSHARSGQTHGLPTDLKEMDTILKSIWKGKFKTDAEFKKFMGARREKIIAEIQAREKANGLASRRLPGRIYMQGNSSWEQSAPTMYGAALEHLAIKFQDKFSGVMLLQQDVEKFRGSKVPQSQDFEMSMDIMYGMVRTDLERLEGELERINTTMEESGLTAEQVSDYLYAKHAGERNIYINSKRPEMLDGSGMTTQEAEDIINELETPEMVAVAKLVYDIVANTRKTMVEGGLEKASTIETYEGLYKNYVPLSGLAADEIDDENNNYPTGGAGMAIYGKTTKAAKGRASKTGVNLIANVIMQNAMVKQRARKDQAMLSLYNLTKNNPNEKVWGVYSAKNPRMKTDETGQQVGMNAFEMKASPNMVPIRINGEQHFIYFKKKDYADALNGMTSEKLGVVGRKVTPLMNLMRNSFTQYNPAFFVGNYFRDVHGAIYNVLAEVEREGGIMQGYGINSKDFTKDVIKGSFTTLRALLNESAFGREMSEEMKEHLNEWKAAGGRTGFSYSETINNVMENMRAQAETKTGLRKGAKIVFKKPIDFFEYIAALNESFENSIRLSAYIEARKVGVTKQRAAQLSKNVTINFNKSGELTPALNNMFLFFNASVQGMTRFGRTFQQGEAYQELSEVAQEMTGKVKDLLDELPDPPSRTHEESLEDLPNNPDETPEWKTRISGAQKLAATSVLVSAMQTMVNIALSDRDEDDELVYNKIPEYKKERGFNLMVNGKDYLSLPLGYGYNMFNVIGMLLAEVACGQRDVDDAAMFAAISGHSSFSPIAFGHSETLGGSLLKGVMPTVLKSPADAFAFNQTYYGGQVYREQTAYGVEKPASTLSFRSPEIVQQATTALSEMTGGTENIDGTIEWNADPYYYILQSYWGGAGDFVEESIGMGRAGFEVARRKYNKLAASGTNEEFVDNLLSTPKEDRPIIKFSDVPVLKTIYGGPSRFYDFDLFEENRKNIEQYDKELRKGKETPGNLDFTGVQELKRQLKMADKALKGAWDARKQVRDIEDFIDRSNATYQIQEIERKIVMQFNKAYYELRGQYVDPKPEGIIPMDKIRKAIGTDE